MSSGASDAVSSVGSALAPIGNTVSDLVVNPAVSGALSGGASSALSGGLSAAGSSALGSALAGGSKTKAPATPAAGTQNDDGSTNVSDVVATAPSSTSSTPSLLNLSPALLSAMGGNDFTSSASRVAGLNSASANFANSPNEPTDVSEVVATAPSLASPAIESAAPSPGQVPGLMSNESGLQDLNYDLLHQGGTDEQKKQTLMQKLGLQPKDLLGLGLLGLGYASSQGKPGIETNQNYQDLAASADQNKQLISQLSQSADAGRMGNIGGSAMNQIRQTVRNAQAAIRQRYSSMGMSGSTAETSDLNAAVQQGLDAQFKFGQDIATSGLQAVAQLSNVNANIYSTLLKAQTAQDTDLGNALANFVGKASGALHTPNIAPATTAAAQAA